MGSHIGYDRALELISAHGGTSFAIRANDEGYAIVSLEGAPVATINAITFDALERNRQIKAAPEYDTDIGRIFVHRAFDPAVRAAHQMNGEPLLNDDDRRHLAKSIAFNADSGNAYEYDRLMAIEAADDARREASGLKPFDIAHDPINLAATLAADAAFAEIADDTIPYIETPAVQIAMAQIARSARIDRGNMDDFALALYRLIDGTPEGEAPSPKLVAAYQRYNAASTALFDARAALLAALINPDMEHSAPYVAVDKIAR